MLRTEKTDAPREGLFEEAISEYATLARSRTKLHFMEHFFTEHPWTWEDAKRQGFLDAALEVCKNYNIALYKGTTSMLAEKVT